jgi:hypothetical protein
MIMDSVSDLFEEIRDEAEDFFEDLWDLVRRKKRVPKRNQRRTVVYGVLTSVRPAYLFAERIDNLLKGIFSLSIIMSGISATFLGYVKLSDLLEVLISTIWGRVVMTIIGSSYLLMAIWKLAYLERPETKR